ncbi:helix-turn-helix transcriptional regulator [Alkalihalophilus pseudofirmus]|uniref:Helix-turn-helix transcriptional regulator n=1 Tax=Alkalihalophilus pseudofirmus TaxID=79885 RepID=A0AAJ2NQ57_ALKPS|nr:helix-turn-helix transcriptional regulator [Alkalihalophilus pseudofirmus]MDV2886373.1 helix-turn-helix transcriptional regulator [Alkalihalophilus pseudofirmus]
MMNNFNTNKGVINMVRSPLANKLRQLRLDNNLSSTVLAEQFGCSNTHVYYMENDKRGASEDTLNKYADFFHISYEELKELQNHSVSLNKTELIDSESLNEVDDFVTLILSVEEPLRSKFIEECREKLQTMFFSLLTPFGLNDVKKSLVTLRNNWYSVNEIELQEDDLVGNLKLPEQEVYFKLSTKENVCKLELLYEDQRKIDCFTKWLTQPDCTVIQHKKIPHLEEEQKVKLFYWFSPKFTDKDHFHFLKRQHEDLTQLYIQSYKLELMVKNFLATSEEEEAS